MRHAVRYLPVVLLAADLSAILTTLAVALANDTTAVRDLVAVLIAELLIGMLLLVAWIYVVQLTDAAAGGVTLKPVRSRSDGYAFDVTRRPGSPAVTPVGVRDHPPAAALTRPPLPELESAR